MTNKKSLASHKSLGRREVDVQVNVEKKVKTHSFEGEPTAIDTESTVLKRERGDIPRKVNNDHDADMESSPTINIARVSSENSSTKRCRRQPKGSGKLQNMASLGGYFAETASGNLNPHLVTVPIGEDLAGKILSFSRNSSKALCVLSATGTVSSVVLCQSGCVANGLKFVGQFEILHLSVSFTHTEVGGKNRRIGKLSISLSKPDGQVFGGVVVGPLIAATPIQLVVATFEQNDKENERSSLASDQKTSPDISGSSKYP
ncbi:hypothetical protein JRO89_XS10G0184600 [Xanthoceras sorbifolium]|uniref:AT-hook motif nuclear-localized protein n=1 Tax=Xanthoceras sorbifolium TaxID=99658 RepID=A0ABQ8HJK1_9ROSI|nr:hypothetical protein JRO89_XS10G0184600 [Xanthoceras sorbifolium]